jgi:hypothetical protein
MGKQIVVCHLPVPHLGAKTAVSPVLFLPDGKKDVTPRIGRRNGDPCSVSRASVPRRRPSRHPLNNLFRNPCTASPSTSGNCLLSGARRPAPRPPSVDGSCWPEGPTLGSCHKPSYNPVNSLSFVQSIALSLLRGAVCSPSSKVGDLRPPTPVHLSGTSSDERSR